MFSSCTIDSGQNRNGGQIQAPKSVQRKKGLLLRPGLCPQFLHHRSKSQDNWTNTFKSQNLYKERRDFFWDLDLSSDPAPWIQVPKEVGDKCKPQNPYKERRDFFWDLDLWLREGGREGAWVWRELWRRWWRWRSFFFVLLSPHARSRLCSSRRLLLLLSHRRRCNIALVFIRTATTISFRFSSIDHRRLLAPFLASIQKKAPWRNEEGEHYRSGCSLRSRPRLHSFSSGGKSLQIKSVGIGKCSELDY